MCLLRYKRAMVSRQGVCLSGKNGGKSLSYTEFSDSLASGWLPRETVRKSKKKYLFFYLFATP